jgi:outer membrane protein assembly factor BamB
MTGGNEFRTNHNDKEKWLTPPLALAKRFQVPGLQITSLLFANGRVYASGWGDSDRRNKVVALDATGKPVWAFTLESSAHPSDVSLFAGGWRTGTVSAFVDGMVVISSSRDPNLYGLTGDTGKLVWKTATGGELGGRTLLVRDQTMYALLNDALIAIDARTGRRLWRTAVRAGGAFASPVSFGSSILVIEKPGDGYQATAIAPDGSIHRSLPLQMSVTVDPAVSVLENSGGQRISMAFITAGSQLAAQTIVNETPVWTSKLDWVFPNMPALSAAYELVIARSSNESFVGLQRPVRFLVAFDMTSGREVWRFETQATGPSVPVIANWVAYVTSRNPSKVFAISMRDGRELWSEALPAAPTGEPIVANGQLYVPLGNSICVYGPAQAGR